MSNRQYIGTVCIRNGNRNQEPTAVYVAGINSFESLICRVLNTGNMMFCDPDSTGELVDFNFETLQKLRAEWQLEQAKGQVLTLEKRITERDY